MTVPTNPWSLVYKSTPEKIRANSIMIILTKPDGSDTTSIQETTEVIYLSI